MLLIKGVNKIFGALEDGFQPVKALENVSLEVREGEFFSIIGPSGCGKSTLLRIIGGLIPGYDGEVRVGNERIQGPHSWIGMVFQEESTFPWRTTLGNVEFGLEMRGVKAAERKHKAIANFASQHPEAVRGFLHAQQKALDFIFDNPKETVRIWIRRAEIKMPEATVLKTWEFYTRAALVAKPIKGIQKTMEDAVKFKFLKQPLPKTDVDKLIDLSYLP